ncbi:MAG: hypothetical protein NZ522_00915 [Chitinophagales bacterium]|nr:hypothetical protein [Chitinophagales bacterium]
MIICADSGSTKTQWLTSEGQLIETIGFNPQFFDTASVIAVLQADNRFAEISKRVSQVYFFGAGCSSPERNSIIASALEHIFPKATIYVEHDLMAAALATYDGADCISCILGTGSNSCFFDGKTITEKNPALGYILGDEGSGSWFGKELLKMFLYDLLPEKTKFLLESKYHLTKEIIFKNVYGAPHANVYLAGFAKVLSESPDTNFVRELIMSGFREFFKYHVVCFENYRTVPVHFVGSLAYHFADILREIASEFEARVGTIDKQPVYKLLNFYLNQKR